MTENKILIYPIIYLFIFFIEPYEGFFISLIVYLKLLSKYQYMTITINQDQHVSLRTLAFPMTISIVMNIVF